MNNGGTHLEASDSRTEKPGSDATALKEIALKETVEKLRALVKPRDDKFVMDYNYLKW